MRESIYPWLLVSLLHWSLLRFCNRIIGYCHIGDSVMQQWRHCLWIHKLHNSHRLMRVVTCLSWNHITSEQHRMMSSSLQHKQVRSLSGIPNLGTYVNRLINRTLYNVLGSKAPFNWLTQSSLDTYAPDFNLTLPTSTQSDSSLLFTIGKSTSKQGRYP